MALKGEKITGHTSGSLAVVGKGINSLLTDLETLDTPSDAFRQLMINEQQRFQLWARNLGLYHYGDSSLEYRLRDSRLFDYTIELLNDLQELLVECTAYLIRTPPTTSLTFEYSHEYIGKRA